MLPWRVAVFTATVEAIGFRNCPIAQCPFCTFHVSPSMRPHCYTGMWFDVIVDVLRVQLQQVNQCPLFVQLCLFNRLIRAMQYHLQIAQNKLHSSGSDIFTACDASCSLLHQYRWVFLVQAWVTKVQLSVLKHNPSPLSESSTTSLACSLSEAGGCQ